MAAVQIELLPTQQLQITLVKILAMLKNGDTMKHVSAEKSKT